MPTKRAIDSLAKEMLEDVPLSEVHWATAPADEKDAYRAYARMVLEAGERRDNTPTP